MMRRSTLVLLLSCTFMIALAGVASSAGGGGHGAAEGAHAGFPWFSVIAHAVNFGILCLILFLALRRPLKDFLVQRNREVREALSSAACAREEAEALVAELKKKVQNADAEAKKLQDELVAQGQAEKQRLLDEAKKQATRIVDEAKRAGDRELERAKVALQAEAVRLASGLATESLNKEIKDADRTAFNKDFVSSLERL